jgi:hypothetical protein
MQKLKKVAAQQKNDRDRKLPSKAEVQATKAEAAKLTTDAKRPLWYSPDGTDIHVTLGDGRRAIVGEKPRELPRGFYRAAAQAGCLSTTQINPADYNIPTVPDSENPEKRADAVRKAILDAAQAREDDPEFENAFTPAGLPNILFLSKRLGFAISQAERDAAWNQIKQEIEQTDEEDNAEDQDNA